MLGASFMFIQLITMSSQIYIVMPSHFKIKKLLKLSIFGKKVQQFTFLLSKTMLISQRLRKLPQAYTGDSGAVLIRNHGITVWGRDSFDAKKRLEAYEFLFQFHIKLLSIQGGVSNGANSYS